MPPVTKAFEIIRKIVDWPVNEFRIFCEIPNDVTIWRIHNLDNNSIDWSYRDDVTSGREMRYETLAGRSSDVPPINPGRLYVRRTSSSTTPTVVVIYTTSREPSVMARIAIMSIGSVTGATQSIVPELTEFTGQKVYFDPLRTNTMGAEVHQHYLLTQIPLETNADDEPTQSLDSTVVSMKSDINDIERINVYFHESHCNIGKICGYGAVMITVEAGRNARCTTARCRLYRKRIADDTLTPITEEKVVTVNVDETIRHVRFILQDLENQEIPPGEVLVLRVSIWGRQVSSELIPSYLVLWHRRGTFDCKLELETVSRGG